MNNDENKITLLAFLVVVGFMCLIMAVNMCAAQWSYGDYKCAFAQCRVLK